jgi:hypothetical protein
VISMGRVASRFSPFGVSMPKGEKCSIRNSLGDLHGLGTSICVYHSYIACVPSYLNYLVCLCAVQNYVLCGVRHCYGFRISIC